VSVADRAAEQVTGGWRADSAGSALLASAEANRARGERAKQEFENAFGTAQEAGTTAHEAGAAPRAASLDRSSPDLTARVTRAVSAWQDQLIRLVQSESLSKRVGGAAYDVEPLSLVTLVAMLGEDAPGRDFGGGPFGPLAPFAPFEPVAALAAFGAPGADSADSADTADSSGDTSDNDDIVTIPAELLASAFGTAESKQLIERARADLADRVRLLLDEELLRFVQLLDSAGPVDPVAAVRLYQAEYSLESAR